MIDCGSAYTKSCGFVDSLVIEANGFVSVMRELNCILEGQNSEASDCVLNTLVIENISSFYWELRESKQRIASYGRLADTLDLFKRRYACNIIVTAWDSDFEKGYNYKRRRETPKVFQDLSFIPKEFFKYSNHIYAIGQKNYKFNDQWQQIT